MDVSTEQLELIGSIYDAAIDPFQWTKLLDRLAAQMNAKGGLLIAVETLNEAKFSINQANSIYTTEWLDQYFQECGAYEEPAWNIINSGPAGKIISCRDIWPDMEQLRDRPDNASLEKSFGIFDRVAAKLNDERAWRDAVAIQFPSSHGDITQSERQIFSLFIPHLAKSVSLFRGFSMLRARFKATLGALDRFHIGLFLVTSSGNLVLKNRTGQRVLEKNNGIKETPNGLLSFSDPHRAARLQNAIAIAAQTASAEHIQGATVLRVPKLLSDESYLVEVSPLRDTEGEIELSFKGALVSVIDPDDKAAISIKGLEKLYGLTPAESKVTSLLIDGNSAPEIADIRSVSPGTVQQQVKAILAKTGSRNRVELVRRAITLNLPIDEPDDV